MDVYLRHWGVLAAFEVNDKYVFIILALKLSGWTPDRNITPIHLTEPPECRVVQLCRHLYQGYSCNVFMSFVSDVSNRGQ